MDIKQQNHAAAIRLHSAISARADRLGLSFRQVADELGMPSSALTRLRDGRMPTWARAVQLMRWAGLGLADLSPELDSRDDLELRVRRLFQAGLSLLAEQVDRELERELPEELGDRLLRLALGKCELLTARVTVALYSGMYTDGGGGQLEWDHEAVFPHRLPEPE